MRAVAKADLVPGMTFKRGPAKYYLRSIDIEAGVMVCELQGQRLVTIQFQQFLQEYLDGHVAQLQSEHRPISLVEHRPLLDGRWHAASEKDRERASFQWHLLRAVEGEGPVLFDSSGRLNEQLVRLAKALKGKPPSRSTFHRWYHAHVRGGGTVDCQLRRGHARGHHRKSKLHEFVQQVLDEELELFKTGQYKRTSHEWASAVNERIAAYNQTVRPDGQLSLIHRSTWGRRIAQLAPIERVKGTRGKAAAKNEFKFVQSVEPPSYALQVVLVDHTRLRLRLWDEVAEKLYSEAWVTVMLCARTKVILSFAIHVARHDVEVAAKCFEMMVLPKTDFKKWCPGAKNDWPCYGIPVRLVADNGLEFLAIAFSAFVASFGTLLTWAPSHTPEWKGGLERWFRTLKGSVISRLLGAMMKPGHPDNPRKADKPKDAYTMAELTVLIAAWIVDHYHQNPHRELKMSPMQAWKRDAPHTYISVPASVDDLLSRTGKVTMRYLTRQGIELNGDRYAGSELEDLFKRLGPDAEKVSVVSSARSAYKIFVLDPVESKYVVGININSQCRAEYTREHWELVKRAAKENNLNPHTVVGASSAAALVERTNEEVKLKRATHRAVARQARARGVDSDQTMKPGKEVENPTPVKASELIEFRIPTFRKV